MRWIGAAVLLVFVGCAAPASPATPVPLPPTATLPAATPAPTARPVVLEPRTRPGEFFQGRDDAPVTFEEFGDFQCPVCGEFARTTGPTFKQQYVDTGKVKFVWHDYPWIGDESFDAAQAARCAGQQGHFWDYHDYLFAHQRGENEGQFTPTNLEAFASNVGLDRASFSTCFDRMQDLPAIKEALRLAIGMGVDVTPTFLVNGDLKVGAPPMNRLAALMEFYLARSPH